VDVTINVVADAVPADYLLSLYGWLREDSELHGRVSLTERAPEPGTLGSLPEALVVALGSGGPAVLASAVFAWLQRGTGKVSLKLTQADGAAVEIQAEGVRNLTASELPVHVQQLTRALEPPGRS
jgi:hypothetical protein